MQKKIKVQGHRGGFKPDNTLNTFKKSLDSGLEAIELDVWTSKDGIPVVAHGGHDGQLKDYGHPNDFIFDWTVDELKTLVAGENETIPTLEEVFKLFNGKVFINIELKAPKSDEFKLRYDHKKTMQVVHDLVTKNDMHNKFLISSFCRDILKAAEEVREENMGITPHYDVIYLYNNENSPLPDPDVYTSYGDGINISANHITQEVVDNCKRQGKKVGVWIRVKDFKENDHFYEDMQRLGVDFICVDQPLRALEVLNRLN